MTDISESLPAGTQHVHTTDLAVRWGDMDAVGHVNNSRFFSYFEEARVEWLKATLDEATFSESGPVLAHASCDFEHPVRHPTTLHLDVYAESPGRSSLATHYTARFDASDDAVASGTAVLVWVSAETGDPVPVPDLGLQ
ncbi:acyl-CoA thioesterase [Salinibacter altiplanensis]|uniref:acyl-CoA thioesterase n=1 Tax=Salinibacter altiplanensis TaxID=1803181 RepID=UPI000C9F48F3|nr:thioesterase family protein [Salinibacter altiplanensis]